MVRARCTLHRRHPACVADQWSIALGLFNTVTVARVHCVTCFNRASPLHLHFNDKLVVSPLCDFSHQVGIVHRVCELQKGMESWVYCKT